MKKEVIIKLLKKGNVDDKLLRMRWREYNEEDKFTGYLISEYGHVYSLKTFKIMKPFITKHGYYRIELSIHGKRMKRFVHRLVMEAFTIYKDPNKNIVNHKDGNKLNCHISNLEWCTLSDNTQHAYDNRLMAKGSSHHLAKNKEEVILKAIEMIEKEISVKEISDKLGLSKGLVRDIKNRKAWRHLTDNNEYILQLNKDREDIAKKLKTLFEMNDQLTCKKICEIIKIPYNKVSIALINKIRSVHLSSTTRES